MSTVWERTCFSNIEPRKDKNRGGTLAAINDKLTTSKAKLSDWSHESICMTYHLLFFVTLTVMLAAFLGLLIIAPLTKMRMGAGDSLFAADQIATLFIFDGETLVDCSPAGRVLLASAPALDTPRKRLLAALATKFPDLEGHLQSLEAVGTLNLTTIQDTETPLLLSAQWRGGLCYISLIDTKVAAQGTGPDPIAHHAMSEELSMLRNTLAHAPLLIWREALSGDVIWANASYLSRAKAMLPLGQDLSWPLPKLFSVPEPAIDIKNPVQRLQITNADKEAEWFEVNILPDRMGRQCYASSIDGLIGAETSLRDFMQTLAKTFAHLPIGLAIFDHKRQLQLFNPALLDLTNLPADFLSRKPSLSAMLDALREKKIVPEPKDYREWRRQLLELERAASSGIFDEVWTLPEGQTYRVTGRPHPNGALAFLIEDISNEIGRSRRYRADIELSQAVLDTMEEAVAVFSDSGLLVSTNAAYGRLWGYDHAEGLLNGGIDRLTLHWQSLSTATPLWAEVNAFCRNMGERQPWQGQTRLLDGRLLTCRIHRLPAGATMVGFRPAMTQEFSAAQPDIGASDMRLFA